MVKDDPAPPWLRVPAVIPNLVGGADVPAAAGGHFAKLSPHDGRELWLAADSGSADVDGAVLAARRSLTGWGQTPGVERGLVLHRLVRLLQDNADALARIVADETGKSHRDALAETGGAAQLGLFFASEGQRLYGRTTTSAVRGRYASTVREPVGVAGLIVPANTPIANVAWKVFPALICGNSAVLKSAEDAPATAWAFGVLARAAGIPAGVLNIVHGFGPAAGAPLVAHPDVAVISFTGSTQVGRSIQRAAADRLARVSLELGGKNPFVVCDDADLGEAARWAALSAFSNAGQRCASGSRIIVMDSVYESFRDLLAARTRALRVGPGDEHDLGPVINHRQMASILAAIDQARAEGATVVTGGVRLDDTAHAAGCYVAPTLVEGVDPASDFARREIFGPVAGLFRVPDFEAALALANDSPYGLTACIHTTNVHRAHRFVHGVNAGVAVVNAGTFGSEPHMPFGGVGLSGNGTREPGTEALEVYSRLKDIYITVRQDHV